MDKIIIKDVGTGRQLTKSQFDEEVYKVSFDPETKYTVIYTHDLIEAVIKMRAAIQHGIVFVMMPFYSTENEQNLLLERIEKGFVEKPNGYQLAITSGTTSQSKIIYSTRDEREMASRRIIQQTKITQDDVIYILRLAGNGAWVNAITTATLSGATMLVSNETDIPTVAKYINENRPSVIFSSPVMMKYLMNDDKSDTFKSSVRCWYVSGSHLVKEDGYFAESKLGDGKILHGCLRAEGFLPLVCSIDDTQQHRIETNGKEIVSNSTRIVDGELQIHSDHISSLLDAEHKFTDDGWYPTGDLVEQDADGYFKIVGRTKLLFSYGPLTINPLEIEEIVDRIPGVIKSYCVDYVPKTPDRGIHTFCVCVKRDKNNPPTEIKKILYDNKSIRYRFHVYYINEFPMTHSDKIDRRALTAYIAEKVFFMNNIFIRDISTNNEITKSQFDDDTNSMLCNDSGGYALIDYEEPIDMAIKMYSAIKNKTVFMMLSKSTTSFMKETLKQRIHQSFKPMSDGFQITASGGSATHAKLLYATRQQRDKHSEILIQQLKLTPHDVVLNTRNAGSGPWINIIRQCKIVGARVLLINDRDPEQVARLINEYSVTVICSTPQLMSRVIKTKVVHNNDGNIRCWHVSGSPTDTNDAYEMEAMMNGCKFIQTLGRAEGVLPYGCGLDDTLDHRVNTIGKELVHGSTRIVDGEMQIAKEWVIPMLDGEHTFTDDGWYKTGDLVEQDSEGYYKVVGCKKPILSYGPRDVNPYEVEELVDSIDGVIKSYCIDINLDDDPNRYPCVCVMRVTPIGMVDEMIIRKMVLGNLQLNPYICWIESLETMDMSIDEAREHLTRVFKSLDHV